MKLLFWKKDKPKVQKAFTMRPNDVIHAVMLILDDYFNYYTSDLVLCDLRISVCGKYSRRVRGDGCVNTTWSGLPTFNLYYQGQEVFAARYDHSWECTRCNAGPWMEELRNWCSAVKDERERHKKSAFAPMASEGVIDGK